MQRRRMNGNRDGKRFECMIRVGICSRYAWMEGRVEIVVW